MHRYIYKLRTLLIVLALGPPVPGQGIEK